MNRAKLKLKLSLVISIYLFSITNAQILLNSDLMIQEIEFDENFLPQKEIVHLRDRRDEELGSGSFEFTTNIDTIEHSESKNDTKIINKEFGLVTPFTVVVKNESENSNSTLIIVLSVIGGVIALGIVVGSISVLYYVKKRSHSVNPNTTQSNTRPHNSNHTPVVTYEHTETDGTRKINVKNTTITEVSM